MATAASAEELARENAIVEKAAAIRALWATLSSAFNFPHPEPPRNKTHWDFVLQEASWLAQDFMQERLWRQAAAYQVAHAAAAFKRSSLRQVTTIERKASDLRLGHVREPEKLAAEYAAKAVHLTSAAKLATDRRTQRSRSSSVTSATNSDGVQSATVDMGSLCFITTSAFTPALTQQLEAQDVSRLAQHAEVQALYSQVLDAARKTQPVVTLEDLLGPPGGRRKLRGAALLAGGASGLGLEGDDGLDINGSPLPGRLTTGGVRGRPSSLAVGVNGMRALDGSELGDTGARDKRKRRGRDCGVDEDYEPTKISKAGTGGVRPGPVSGLRADGRALGAELGAAAGASQGAVGLAGDKRGLQQQVAGLKMTPGRSGLPRLDSISRLGDPTLAGPYGRTMPGAGPWTQQDDQILIAIVAEFGQNWYLVADVLRATSVMAGIARRFDLCKQRYCALQKLYLQPESEQQQELRPEQLATPLMNKQQAKEVLLQALPVQEMVLQNHQRALANVAMRLSQCKQQERLQSRERPAQLDPSLQCPLWLKQLA
ncbi:hypothetical protein V8C86DRAFT_744167 [Haematococcus lacustris]